MTDDVDVDYIDVLLAVGQPRVAFYDVCPWCNHEWHGLGCDSCGITYCETSTGARDDSWRPRLPRNRSLFMLELMGDTGCDGWVADAATSFGSTEPLRERSLKLQRYLYGRAR